MKTLPDPAAAPRRAGLPGALAANDPSTQTVDGLRHAPDGGREGDERVGAAAHRRLLDPVVAHFLDVLPGDDPGRPRSRRAVERHEVGPWLLEPKPDAPRIRSLDGRDLLLE